jgi:enamine deaminase RidA (YjgF/YER057c/UK114 family)
VPDTEEQPMIERLQPGPRMSQAVIHGDTVYLAGQVATDPSAGVAGQTRQILESIDRLPAHAFHDQRLSIQFEAKPLFEQRLRQVHATATATA